MNYQLSQIMKVMNKKGYALFTTGNYNINIIGIRNLTSGNGQNDLFNDQLYLIYKLKGEWRCNIYPITTDPGKSVLKNPINRKGTAILVPSQYRGAYQLGYHQGKYEALVQRGKVKVYRDNNRDSVMDFHSKEEGHFGINIHKAGIDSTYVGSWSTGCQVFRRAVNFYNFLNICKKSAAIYGNKFTYTLLTSNDFDELL